MTRPAFEVDRSELEAISQAVTQLHHSAPRCLARQVDAVFVTGGSSLVPTVQPMLANRLVRPPAQRQRKAHLRDQRSGPARARICASLARRKFGNSGAGQGLFRLVHKRVWARRSCAPRRALNPAGPCHHQALRAPVDEALREGAVGEAPASSTGAEGWVELPIS